MNTWGFTFVVVFLFCSNASAQLDVSKGFGEPVSAVSIDQIKGHHVKLIENALPENLIEVIMVSGYEPPQELSAGQIVKVILDRPNSTILLVLTSYERVIWQVEATPNTKVSAILVGGYKKSELVTDIDTKGYWVKLPYAYEQDNIKFVQTLSKLNQWFGIKKIDAMRGQYRLPAEVKISTLDTPTEAMTLEGYSVQLSEHPRSFSLLDKNSNVISFTQSGRGYKGEVIDTKSVVVNYNTFYRITNNGIALVTKSGDKLNVAEIPLAPNFPMFSWPSGIAWDSKRNIITVVSFGGEGYLYRYDVAQRKWLDVRSLNNKDILYLTYDVEADQYVGWVRDSHQMIFISPTGEFLSEKKFDLEKLPNFNRQIDSRNGPSSNVILVATNSLITLMQVNDTFRGKGKILNIWDYDLNTQKATLTYKAPQDISVPIK